MAIIAVKAQCNSCIFIYVGVVGGYMSPRNVDDGNIYTRVACIIFGLPTGRCVSDVRKSSCRQTIIR